MALPPLQFLVLLAPADTARTLWCASVVCNEGPTALHAARRYRAAVDTAERSLRDMLRTQHGEQAVIWRVETTDQVAEDLLRNSPRRMLNRIPSLRGKDTKVRREEITIR